MRVVLNGVFLLLAACGATPPDDPANTHVCTTSPQGLVECSEIE